MRLDRPQINSCQVDVVVSALNKINAKDKCVNISGIFHGRRVCICKLQQYRMMFDWQ